MIARHPRWWWLSAASGLGVLAVSYGRTVDAAWWQHVQRWIRDTRWRGGTADFVVAIPFIALVLMGLSATAARERGEAGDDEPRTRIGLISVGLLVAALAVGALPLVVGLWSA